MRVIGLTGSIATGKTTTGKMFNHLKIPVHDSDKTVHDLIGPYGAAVPMIIELFGNIGTLEKGIDKKTGNVIVDIDRKFFRPTEVDFLRGDFSKARKNLKWKPKINFKDLVKEMIEYEINTKKKNCYLSIC